MIRSLSFLGPLVAATLVVGCATGGNIAGGNAGGGVGGSGDAAAQESARASQLPPMTYPADNAFSDAKARLGAQLFVDPRLSGSGKMACQGCHYRNLGWTDAQVLSRKDNGDLNTRHTPGLYNVGYQSAWYWDGRAATLEGQILAAWRNQIAGDPPKVALALNAIEGYRSQFQLVFGSEATPDAIVKALATYLRTKNSTDSPWDRYEAGDRRAVSRAAVRGNALFNGKGRCITCHAPPFYGNSTFYNIGLEAGKAKPDPGRFNTSKDEADRGAFKTPTLRSVALGAPYFHDGSAASLEAAARYMAGGGNADPNRSPLLVPTGLTEREIADVVEFLRSLTSTEEWRAPELPK
jgi:cytochrome c peroxidase